MAKLNTFSSPFSSASSGGGGGGGAYIQQELVNITSAVQSVSIDLAADKQFHQFRWWFEGDVTNDKFFSLVNNNNTLGDYGFQNNSATNGSGAVNEDTSENGITLTDQNTLSRRASGIITIFNPLVDGSTNMREISVDSKNPVTTTTYEILSRLYIYMDTDNITSMQFGYRGFLLSGTSGRNLTSGYIEYTTEA